MTDTYTLKHPFTLTAKPIGADARTIEFTEVTIRRPKAKDLRAIDNVSGEAAKSLALICQLTGLSKVEADEMDAEDFASLSEIVAGFFPTGPATGGTLSAT